MARVGLRPFGHTDTQFMMLTVYEDSESIFRALKAGADGYLVKSSPPEVLLNAIEDVRGAAEKQRLHGMKESLWRRFGYGEEIFAAMRRASASPLAGAAA